MGDRRVAISPLQGFDRERNLGSQGVAGFPAVALGYCISPLRGFKPTATTYGVEQTKVVQGSGQTHGFERCYLPGTQGCGRPSLTRRAGSVLTRSVSATLARISHQIRRETTQGL